jgi:ABC-type Mn2+/Zn2+ transport system ATPase subunit
VTEGAPALLQCESVTVGYGRRVVVAGIDLRFEKGSYLGIVGPNGCGKTTFLKTVLGILPPLGGVLRWEEGRRPRIGYVPQRDAIDPIYPFRASEVVMLALGAERVLGGGRRRELRDRAARALERVGLSGQGDVGYSELSGGQRQRVLVARALATDPELLALDEPTSGLDPGGAERLLDLVDSLRAERRLSVMLVSHDLSLVARRATHVLVMHEGRTVTGPVRESLTAEQLTRLFGHPLGIFFPGGRATVVPSPRESA